MVTLSAGINALPFTSTLSVFLLERICQSRERSSMGLPGKSRALRCRAGATRRAEVSSPPRDTAITSHCPLHPTLPAPTRRSGGNPGACSQALSFHGHLSAASSQTDQWVERHVPRTKRDQSRGLEFKVLGWYFFSMECIHSWLYSLV